MDGRASNPVPSSSNPQWARMRSTLACSALLGALTLVAVALAPVADAAAPVFIAAIDASRGVVTGREAATGRTFRFIVRDRRLIPALRTGLPVNINRRTGLSVQGLPQGCCVPIWPGGKAGKPTGPTGPTGPPQIDCSATPELCPGGKPGGKLTFLGSFWDDLNDFCGEHVSASPGDTPGSISPPNCVDPTQAGP